MMKKKVVWLLLLIALVVCGCGKTRNENEVETKEEWEILDTETSEEKKEGLRIVFAICDEEFSEAEIEDTIYKLYKRIETECYEMANVYRNAIAMINVDVPGMTDTEAFDGLGNKGELLFVLGTNNVELTGFDDATGAQQYSFLKSWDEIEAAGDIILEGKDILSAEVAWYQEYNVIQNVVSLTFTEDGAEKFAKATGDHIGEMIAIVYDGEVLCMPVVQQQLTDGKAQISGDFTQEEANDLAMTLRIGNLPLELQEISREVVEIK